MSHPVAEQDVLAIGVFRQPAATIESAVQTRQWTHESPAKQVLPGEREEEKLRNFDANLELLPKLLDLGWRERKLLRIAVLRNPELADDMLPEPHQQRRYRAVLVE